jgi:hypothetical protein
MRHLDVIEKDIRNGITHTDIVRKVYLTYPTFAFIGDEEVQYEILNEIADFFVIPINTIQVTGSGKLGRSLHKDTDFNPLKSDLDISIINSDLYIKYMEIVFKVTDGHRDGTLFPVDLKLGGSVKESYLKYLSKGMFRIDMMPTCCERASVRGFFSRLSTKYSSKFKSINAGIYISQCFFEMKQRSAIEAHLKNSKKVT